MEPSKSRKPLLDYIYVPITLKCNRNCKGCVCFSPLVKKETEISLSSFEKALIRLIEIIGSSGVETLQQFDISGGEPLIHSNLLEFLRIARDKLPYTYIVIRSNGLLLPEFIITNYKILQDLKIGISICPYPEIDRKNISDLCKRFKLRFSEKHETTDFRFIKTGISLMPNYREMSNEWERCSDGNSCHTLRIIDDNTAYYTGCSTPAYIDIFDEYFNISFENLLKKGDRINIFNKDTSLNTLLDFHQPIAFCAHCRRRTGIFYENTEISERNIDEWLVGSSHINKVCFY